MDYEKKYKEALERARQFSEHPLQEDSANIVEYIFPELAESEDERIRKRIYNYINAILDDNESEEKEKWLTWLEKQGGIDNCPLECSTNTVMTDSTKNQVKPKFKVGDWITDGEAVFHITSYSIDYGYHLETPKGKGTSFHFSNENVENKYHLWTIQDAKDGDVLATKWGAFIVKELDIINPNGVIAYCGINSMGRFDKCDGIYPWTDEKITPATEEQRDTLMKAMADAGYKWNKEELKLEKI